MSIFSIEIYHAHLLKTFLIQLQSFVIHLSIKEPNLNIADILYCEVSARTIGRNGAMSSFGGILFGLEAAVVSLLFHWPSGK